VDEEIKREVEEGRDKEEIKDEEGEDEEEEDEVDEEEDRFACKWSGIKDRGFCQVHRKGAASCKFTVKMPEETKEREALEEEEEESPRRKGVGGGGGGGGGA
jgi:hypothetical protein